MDAYQISFLYQNDDKISAMETFEDLQSELSALKIPLEKGKNRSIICYHVFISFQNIDKNPKIKALQGKIFAPSSLKHNPSYDLESFASSVSYHSNPFQSLVELVLETQKEVRRNPTYLLEALQAN